MRVRAMVLAFVALFAASTLASAQQQTGEIFGKVTDSSGAVLPGVTVTLSAPHPAAAADRDHERNGHLSVPASADRHVRSEVRADRLQDGGQPGHLRHRRLQRAGQRAAGRLDRAGDDHRHRREPDRRHEEHRDEADVHQRAAPDASRRRATRGSSSSRRPASPWTARTSAATCRASSPTTCRAAATRSTTSGRSTASTSPTWRRPARRPPTSTSTRSRK